MFHHNALLMVQHSQLMLPMCYQTMLFLKDVLVVSHEMVHDDDDVVSCFLFSCSCSCSCSFSSGHCGLLDDDLYSWKQSQRYNYLVLLSIY